MAWVRLDDKFTSHPKVLALTDREFRVHLSALCYAAEYKTDGDIPEAAWRLLGVTRKLADRMVAVGVWDIDAGTYLIHDFRVYNPADPTAAERQRRFKESRSGNGQVTAESREDNGETNGPHARARTPVPVPSPTPNREGSPDGAPSLANALPAARPRDELWDALTEACGPVSTKSERGRRNAALRELRDIGATPDEIRWRSDALKRRWPDIDFTATSLVANWSIAERPQPTGNSDGRLDSTGIIRMFSNPEPEQADMIDAPSWEEIA